MPLTSLPRNEDAFSSSRPLKRAIRIIKSTPGECDMLLVVLDTLADVNPAARKHPQGKKETDREL
jgi:hypothetical protein